MITLDYVDGNRVQYYWMQFRLPSLSPNLVAYVRAILRGRRYLTLL